MRHAITTDFHSVQNFPMITSAALTVNQCLLSMFVINVSIENTKFGKTYGQVLFKMMSVIFSNVLVV